MTDERAGNDAMDTAENSEQAARSFVERAGPAPPLPEPFVHRIRALFRRDYFVGGISPTYYVTRWLFLRMLGLVHLIAFTSYGSQIEGLIGSNGIAPAQRFLDLVSRRSLESLRIPLYFYELDTQIPLRYLRVPTLCWLTAGDWFLQGLCLAGVLAALLLVADLAPPLCLAALYVCYLSLVSVSPDFLSFQWDALLLETTFLSVFFAPWKLRPGIRREEVHSRVMLMMLRWLLFRLMFMSGVVKLGDGTWRDLTALTYHYETQPLPTVFGWYAAQLPAWFHKFSVIGVLLIELVVPILLVAPRRVRAVVCAVFVCFQLAIGLTGNYTFFNLLTIALCLLLLDDRHWQALAPNRLASWVARPPLIRLPLWRKVMMGLIAVPIVFITAIQMTLLLPRSSNPPPLISDVLWAAFPYHVANRYGLFARMTTSRPEIIVEGSNDGISWEAYEFRWKPGRLDRAPGWVQPHQPRLDWQMWFAALSPTPRAWFGNFCYRLLQGSPEVLALLEHNPFPDSPPRYVRAMLYDFTFTDISTKRQTGHWWSRSPAGIYMLPMELPR